MKILFFILLLLSSFEVFCSGYQVEEVEFVSHGDTLSGSIVFPNTTEMYAAVVFVHGSGEQTRSMHWAERFASQGITALVYDKRGVGQSGGEYEGNQSVSEKNIVLLADDSLAAFSVLHKHPKTKKLLLGLTGISQAGWVVPLAAEKNSAVNFTVLWSSPVCKVSEEDIFSKYTMDRDGGKVPSYNEALQSRERKYIWPDFLGKDTDPSESLAKLDSPGLWIYGELDGSIPVDLSVSRLQQQIGSGGRYEYVLFSGLGHNNMSETFATAAGWIKRLSKKILEKTKN